MATLSSFSMGHPRRMTPRGPSVSPIWTSLMMVWFGKANDTVALNVAHFKLLKMDKSDLKIIISLIFPWLSTAGSSKKM